MIKLIEENNSLKERSLSFNASFFQDMRIPVGQGKRIRELKLQYHYHSTTTGEWRELCGN
jgi:hypothetical protein